MSTEEPSLSFNIGRKRPGYTDAEEVLSTLRKKHDSEREIIELLAEAAVKIGENWSDLLSDRREKLSEATKRAKVAEEYVDKNDRAMMRIGDCINQMLMELPSTTVRDEFRNDIKKLIDDKGIFKVLGIKSSRRVPANPQFLFTSPTLDPKKLTREPFGVHKHEQSGIQLWSFSAASSGTTLYDCQDAISYTFDSWGENADIPLGIVSIADGVTQSDLAGQWARLLVHHSTHSTPYPIGQGVRARKIWWLSVKRIMAKTFDKTGLFRNYLKRADRDLIDRLISQQDAPEGKIVNCASTLMQLRFDGRKQVSWSSVGDSYLFHRSNSPPDLFGDEELRKFIPIHHIERSSAPPAIAFSSTPPPAEHGQLDLKSEDILVATTDQLGEYLSKAEVSIQDVIEKLTRCTTTKSMKEVWRKTCEEVWESIDDDRDDLTMIVILFDPKRVICAEDIDEYLRARTSARNDEVREILDNGDVDDEIIFKTRLGEKKLKLRPWEAERATQGAFAHYYRLTDGYGFKLYKRQDIEYLRTSFINQFLLTESFTTAEHGIRKWKHGFKLPSMEFVEKVNGHLVTGVLMEHIEGERLQRYFIDAYVGEDIDHKSFFQRIDQSLYDALEGLRKFGLNHGDVCASNIIVQEDGTIYLVDLDTMYASNLIAGDETGKPGYNPLYQWNSEVDLTPYIVISLSLKLLGTDYDTILELGAEDEDRLLLSPEDVWTIMSKRPENLLSMDDPSDTLSHFIEAANEQSAFGSEIKGLLFALKENAFNPNWDELKLVRPVVDSDSEEE